MIRFLFSLFALTTVYATDYTYFSPEMIRTHLNGYTDSEITAIDKDLSVVRSVCINPGLTPSIDRPPVYVATAGGPGSRKTTILERFIQEHPSTQAVYLDPDARGMRFMVHTYYAQSLNHRVIAQEKNYNNVLKTAYEKWRGGSNYIALTLLEETFHQGLDIFHGTTSTGSHIEQFFPAVKNAGYRIELLLCSCDDVVRDDALEYREHEIRHYQVSKVEAMTKGKLFALRMPLYFKYADKLYFYWSESLSQPERLAAVLDGNSFEITDLEAYVQFVGKYEADRKIHQAEGIDLPSFKELLSSRAQ